MAAAVAVGAPAGPPEAATAGKGVPAAQGGQPAHVISLSEAFEDGIITALGGPVGMNTKTFTGYGGEWRTWVYERAPGPGPQALEPTEDGCRMNRRVARLKDPETRLVEQFNCYQDPSKSKGAGSLKQSKDNAYDPHKKAEDVRPDGYAVKGWDWSPDTDFMQVDTKAWLQPDASPLPEKSMRLLPLPGAAGCAIVFGALPHSFDVADYEEGRTDWAMEIHVKDIQGTSDQRCSFGLVYASLSRLERLLCIYEKHMEVEDMEAAIDPDSLAVANQRPRLVDGIEAHVAAAGVKHGTFMRLSYNQDRLLQRGEGTCTWGSHAGGPGAVELLLPNAAYVRSPDDLAAAVEAAGPDGTIVFEMGCVLRNGSLRRWLIEYEAGGRRLLRSATFERYGDA